MSNTEENVNRTTPKHKLDTADFLAFSDSQPTEFCPTSSSSPQKHWKQSQRNNFQNKWNNQRFSGNFRNNSYNSVETPRNRSFNGSHNTFQQRRYGSPNHSFNSSNHSYNSSFNSSWSRNDSSYNSPKNTGERGVNIFSYLHPSFMEDPWAKLERQKVEQEQDDIEPELLNESSSGSDEVPAET